MKVAISKGNSKTGRIPAVSLVPVKDCANCEQCRKDCYALKAWRQYPGVRSAWGGNSKIARNNPNDYFRAVSEYVARRQSRFFRWHVAGDILNQEYFAGMVRVARENPNTKFLAFTKRHDLCFGGKPENLEIVLSMWPGMPMPRHTGGMRIAWCQDGNEDRVPQDALQCPGNCETCGMCWQLKGLKRDVVFNIH